MRRLTFVFFATLILLGATFLRIADLHRYPPGLHYDEAADMLLSRDIAWYGFRPFPVVTAYSGREILFYYVAAPLLRIFGTNVMATRLTSAFLGILAVAATIALGKVLTRRRTVALLAGAWFAVSGPEVWLTRQGFRTSPQPFLEALGFWLLWVALRRVRRWMLPAILGGFFTGLALYVYMAARILPVWLPLPLIILVLVDRPQRMLRVRQAGVFLVALIITAAPIGWFYASHLDVFTDRLSQLAPTDQTPTLFQSLLMHLEMFFIRGDPLLRYNLDVGRPFFDPVSGLLLLVGFVLAAYRLFRAPCPLEKTGAAFVALCPLLIVPSIIAVQGLPPSHMRSVAMIPLVFFLPVFGFTWLARRIPRRMAGIVAVVLLIGLGLVTWRDYQVWGARSDLFYDSDGDLNLAAQWLEQNTPPNAILYIASKYYEHPTILAHDLDPKVIHWMMADHLFVPPPDREAIYIFPRSVDSTPWLDTLKAGVVTNLPTGPDSKPAFVAYRFVPGQFARPTPSIRLDANVNGILRLRGADLPSAISGARARVRLYWEVLAAPGRDDLSPVVSLTDAWDNEIARVTPYFEHTGQWLPGEWLIQDVSLDIAAGNPPGDYMIKVAWVGKARPNDYLPLLDAKGRFAGLWVTVQPLRLAANTMATTRPPSSAVEFLPGIYAQNTTPLPPQIRQGEHLRFSVNWLASKTSANTSPLRIVADLVNSSSGSKVLWSGQPVHDTYPITAWTPRQQIIDRYDIAIPLDLAPGEYRISLSMDGAQQALQLGTIQVIAVARDFTVPPLAHRVNWAFGEAITLAGYEVQKTDQQVTVKIAWLARAAPDRDYTVFVHLSNPDGSIFSQRDSPPTRPTSQWIPGEVVTDTYTLPTPPGDYAITVGLYLQENGFRLPVNDPGGAAIGDEATLKVP